MPMAHDRPANFPPMTLTTMRHLAALDEADGRRGGADKQQRLARALDALYHGFWVEHRETHKPEVLSPLLERVLGTDEAAEVVEAAPAAGKAALQRNTDEALARAHLACHGWCAPTPRVIQSPSGVSTISVKWPHFSGCRDRAQGAWKSLL